MSLSVNDDSEDSDRPKRKKSRSMWGDSDSEDSDNSWRQRKKKYVILHVPCRVGFKLTTIPWVTDAPWYFCLYLLYLLNNIS